MVNLLSNYCKILLNLKKINKAKEIVEESYKDFEKTHGLKNT
jgi:hypothetical protein